MELGADRYPGIASAVEQVTGAKGTIVIIFDGRHGTALCASIGDDLCGELPARLRSMATDLEKDLRMGR